MGAVLLCAHEGCTDAMTAERTGMQRRSVGALQQRFVEEGIETTMEREPRGHRPRALAGEDEARLTTLVCGPARRAEPVGPCGYERMSGRLLSTLT
ncbi:MAG: helix-turn-helix domain-containing protein [Spirochaetaceae bacterium]|nr:helix-turn-helix domain-containing protein [Spirochaetaceae bacterium]